MKRKSGHLHFPDTSTFDPFIDCFLLTLQPNYETDKSEFSVLVTKQINK